MAVRERDSYGPSISERESCVNAVWCHTEPIKPRTGPVVIPAQAGIHCWGSLPTRTSWIPAFAGMTCKKNPLGANGLRCLPVRQRPRTTPKVGLDEHQNRRA